MIEISRLQEEVISQISVLRKEHEAAEKKRSEIDKVAVILGLSASDKPQKASRAAGNLEQPVTAEKKEPVGIPEKSTSSKVEFHNHLHTQSGRAEIIVKLVIL